MITPILHFSPEYKKKYNYTYTNKNDISFTAFPNYTNPKGSLSYDTRNLMRDIIHGYNDVRSRLVGKSEKELESVDVQDFNPIKGLTFYNAGAPNKEINFTFLNNREYSNVFRISLKDSVTKNIDKVYFITNDYAVVKNSYPSEPLKLPETLKFFDSNELVKLGIDSDIAGLFSILDPLLLKLRKSLIHIPPSIAPSAKKASPISLTQVETDLSFKISTAGSSVYHNTVPIGRITEDTSTILKNLSSTFFVVRDAAKKYKPSTLDRIKAAYPDLVLKNSKNGAYIFKNIGDSNEIVTVQDIVSQKHGPLTRIIIENPEDSSVKFFLLSNGRIIKNANPKFPYFIPDTLKYHSDSEVANLEPIINKYLTQYNEKLLDFKEFVVNDLRPNKKVPKKITPVYDENGNIIEKPKKTLKVKKKSGYNDFSYSSGVLSENVSNELSNLLTNYTNFYSGVGRKLSPMQLSRLKRSYPDLDKSSSGLSFKNFPSLEDVEMVNIFKMKRDSVRLSVYRVGQENPDIYLINSSKLVSNYNPVKPNFIPVNLKFASQADLDRTGLSDIIPLLNAKMVALLEYINNPNAIVNSEPLAIKKADFVNVVQDTIQIPTRGRVSAEYNQFLTQCFNDFVNSVKGIQEKIDAFWKKVN